MEAGFDTLLQGGGLALFVWFVIQNNREWRIYLSERNGKLEKALGGLTTSMDTNTKSLERAHLAAEKAAEAAGKAATAASEAAERAGIAAAAHAPLPITIKK